MEGHYEKIALGVTALALALSLTALSAQAQIFKFEHNDTILTDTTIAGLTDGMPAKITVALDNSGSSLNSQTWTAANLQWVKFDFNNGAVLTTFTAPFGGALSNTSGNFESRPNNRHYVAVAQDDNTPLFFRNACGINPSLKTFQVLKT